MNLENFVSNMMAINTQSRIWHWATPSAQHHTTFEKFLTENEALTDSFVESVLGNELAFNVSALNIKAELGGKYDVGNARDEIKRYRSSVRELQQVLEANENPAHGELISILDDVIELSSKTLYLLKLS